VYTVYSYASGFLPSDDYAAFPFGVKPCQLANWPKYRREPLFQTADNKACDMLVNYSDSDSDSDLVHQNNRLQAKRRKSVSPARATPPPAPPPPPPPSFHSLYSTNVRSATADDPSLHGGRSRQIAHVEGNWPTHVYLECESSLPEESDIPSLTPARASEY
jgi:Uncharacterised conserved protein